MDAEAVVVFKEEDEEYSTINVEFKVGGIDVNTLTSCGKVFRIGSTEYPASRLGTWALKDLRDPNEIVTCLRAGGIAAAIIWSMWKIRPEINVWTIDLNQKRFAFEVKKSEKSGILGDIVGGDIAKGVQETLTQLSSPNPYESVRILLIKIITGPISSTPEGKEQSENARTTSSWDEVRSNRLMTAERVAQHMNGGQYSWALPLLKNGLQTERDKLYRLQIALRIYICSIHLKNERELKECLPRVMKLSTTVEIPPEEVKLYLKDVETLFKLLVSNVSASVAIELILAFTNAVKSIPDSKERLDKLNDHIAMIGNAMKLILEKDPSAVLKSQILQDVKTVEDHIEYMRSLTGCDTLVLSQCVYYSAYLMAEVRVLVDKQAETIFRENSIEFKRIASCWADFPYVVTRLRRHPEVSEFMKDQKFCDDLRAISNKPSLLKEKLKDPKFIKTHEVLSSEFGIFCDNRDVKSTSEATPVAAEPEKSTNEPTDPKKESQLEKQKGNDAYKNQQFIQAHQHYDNAIKLDPSDAMLHNNKAAVFMSQGNFDTARTACLFAIQLAQKGNRHDQADLAKIMARLARVEFLDKNFDISLTLFQRSLRLNFDPKVQAQMKECEEAVLAVRFANSVTNLMF